MMPDSPLAPCDKMPWIPHCIPDAYVPHANLWVFALLLIVACLTFVFFIGQTFVRSAIWRKLTLQNAADAAGQISSALRALPLLQGEPLGSVCKSVARNLLVVIDFTLLEAGRYGSMQREGTNLLGAIHNVRREAFKLRKLVVKALFLLRFSSEPATAQQLIVEAADRYVSAVVPAVKELHKKQTDSRERVPVFEIKLPEATGYRP